MPNIQDLGLLAEKDFPEILKVLKKYASHIYLIGGTTRDFLLDNKKPKDLDIEVNLKNFEDWDQLSDDLSVMTEVKRLPYRIRSFSYQGYDFELTLPRVEQFKDERGHKNFDAVFKHDMTPKESFSRRDFSINAIAFDLISNALIDPYDGASDLKNKWIKPILENFSKDPVRFIRALRFKTNLDFNYHESFLSLVNNESLTGLTSHALLKELHKAQDWNLFITDLAYLFPSFKIGALLESSLPIQNSQIELMHLKILMQQFDLEYINYFGLSAKSFRRMIEVIKLEHRAEKLIKLKRKEKELVLNFLGDKS